jgi:hypothetical protein
MHAVQSVDNLPDVTRSARIKLQLNYTPQNISEYFDSKTVLSKIMRPAHSDCTFLIKITQLNLYEQIYTGKVSNSQLLF